MGDVIPISRRSRDITNCAMLRFQFEEFERDATILATSPDARADSIGLVEQSLYRLIAFVPPARRVELICMMHFVHHEMPWTPANLAAVLTCTGVLEDRYIAERA